MPIQLRVSADAFAINLCQATGHESNLGRRSWGNHRITDSVACEFAFSAQPKACALATVRWLAHTWQAGSTYAMFYIAVYPYK